MGEKSDAKLMYSIDGKEFRELIEIPSLSDTVEQADIPIDMDWFRHPQEMTMSFTSKISQFTLWSIFMDKATLIKYCQSIQSNNWLRRHGLPMRRRLR